MGRSENSARPVKLVCVERHEDQRQGLDTLQWSPGADTYVFAVGRGVAPADRARGALAFNVPGELLERLCWLVAIALEHHDTPAAG